MTLHLCLGLIWTVGWFLAGRLSGRRQSRAILSRGLETALGLGREQGIRGVAQTMRMFPGALDAAMVDKIADAMAERNADSRATDAPPQDPS